MRIVAYLDKLDLPGVGVLADGQVRTLAALVVGAGLREELAMLDVRGLLAEDEDLAETRAASARAMREGLRGVPTSQLRLVAPLEPGKIVCVGSNYRSHVAEQGQPIPDHPLLFAKFSNTVIGDGEPVVRPASTQALDLETELGVVIGRRAHRVRVNEALNRVAGYSLYLRFESRPCGRSTAALSRSRVTGRGSTSRADRARVAQPPLPSSAPRAPGIETRVSGTACGWGEGYRLRRARAGAGASSRLLPTLEHGCPHIQHSTGLPDAMK